MAEWGQTASGTAPAIIVAALAKLAATQFIRQVAAAVAAAVAAEVVSHLLSSAPRMSPAETLV